MFSEDADPVTVDRAVQALHRWAGADFYTYIRPISARYFNPDAAADDIMWIVSCEYRNVSWVKVQEHGPLLDEVICRVDVQMPERPAGYVVEKPLYTWLAPFAHPTQRLVVARKAPEATSTARHARIVALRRRR
jgi:hypothetical protein